MKSKYKFKVYQDVPITFNRLSSFLDLDCYFVVSVLSCSSSLIVFYPDYACSEYFHLQLLQASILYLLTIHYYLYDLFIINYLIRIRLLSISTSIKSSLFILFDRLASHSRIWYQDHIWDPNIESFYLR